MSFMISSIFKSLTFRYAFLGAVLLWAAFPPVDLWPLAWIAPIPWVLLIRREKLDGPRPYFILWLVGFAFWLAVLHWLRLPYWATAFGWLALSFYFAFYLPLFIALEPNRRQSTPPARDFGRAGDLDRPGTRPGASLDRHDHGQPSPYPVSLGGLIQISDLAGAYGVSFVVMFVAACLARALPCENAARSFRPLLPAAAILAAVLAYGYARTAHNETTPGARIALIQGSLDSQFDSNEDPDKMLSGFFKHYFELSQQAVKKYGQLDLIVWPETYFVYPLITYDEDAGTKNPKVQEGWTTIEEYHKDIRTRAENSQLAFKDTTSMLRSPMLVGLEAWYCSADGVKRFNSAAYLSASGKVLGRYDKMHLVMFGEYIPFADYFTWLYNFSPLAMATSAGTQPVAFQVRQQFVIAPNICYESVLPHVIRRQINTLQAQGKEPDVLVNLTNDGWFWGSSELDLHLACGVFRAVEFRKPFLIAANTGFSAWIDADGRIIEKGPRRATATLLAEVRIDHRKSWYLYYGDWPSGICLAGCCVFAAAGLWNAFGKRLN